MKTAHTLTIAPWGGLSLYSRLTMEAGTAMLWPLHSDDRITVLINLLASQIGDIAENEGQIDAIMEVLRVALVLQLQRAAA